MCTHIELRKREECLNINKHSIQTKGYEIHYKFIAIKSEENNIIMKHKNMRIECMQKRFGPQ